MSVLCCLMEGPEELSQSWRKDLHLDSTNVSRSELAVEDALSPNRSLRKIFHWGSPPSSLNAPSANLPHAFLRLVACGTKANAVVVGALKNQREGEVETLLCTPEELNRAELFPFEPDLKSALTGKVISTNNLNLPPDFASILGGRPECFLGQQFDLESCTGVLFGLWLDSAQVASAAEAVFEDAVHALPMLLTNLVNARNYEVLGGKFDAMLTVMPDAVVFVDDEATQVIINPAAAKLLDLPLHGEVGPSKVATAMQKLAERCGTRTDPERWFEPLTSELALELSEDWELQNPRRILHVRSYPVCEETAHGRLWLYEDVTAARDADESIQSANRAKSEFLAMMSHELRTPMTGILGMVRLLHVTTLSAEQQGLVQIMEESAEVLMNVINNILDYCKIEAGRLVLEEIGFSHTNVLKELDSFYEATVREKSLKMTISGLSDKAWFRGDPTRLKQILVHLVGNAIKFTKKGSIDVSCKYMQPPPEETVAASKLWQARKRPLSQAGSSAYSSQQTKFPSLSPFGSAKRRSLGKQGNAGLQLTKYCRGETDAKNKSEAKAKADEKVWVEVKVSDTGEGMTKEQCQSLSSTSQAGNQRRDACGTGLGVAICKGLLSLMGGKFDVESEVGRGTVVTITVPWLIAEESTLPFVDPVPPDKPTVTMRIRLGGPDSKCKQTNCSREPSQQISVLVAEDNKVNQLLIRKMLHHYGHEVELVENGKLAVEAVQSKAFDLVLMDMQMPLLDGLSATKQIRALSPPFSQIPIYALSADAYSIESGPMEESGLDGYLDKPIDWEKISAVVEKILAGRNLR